MLTSLKNGEIVCNLFSIFLPFFFNYKCHLAAVFIWVITCVARLKSLSSLTIYFSKRWKEFNNDAKYVHLWTGYVSFLKYKLSSVLKCYIFFFEGLIKVKKSTWLSYKIIVNKFLKYGLFTCKSFIFIYYFQQLYILSLFLLEDGKLCGTLKLLQQIIL